MKTEVFKIYIAFNKEAFSQLTQTAVELYRLVSNVDGRLEKIEAQGSLVAVTAFIEANVQESQ